MHIIFGHWKYIIKNILFILPFALLPALFLSLSLDYTAIRSILKGAFSGEPSASFLLLFRTWSLVRIDSWLGLVYSVCAVFCVAVFMAIMLALVEKHMRIGKRTLSGAFAQLGNHLRHSLTIVMIYFLMYELWALLTAAVVYSIGGIVDITAGVYVLTAIILVFLLLILVYCATVFYLWFPCLQHTGFSMYEGLRYSYQLMLNIRGRLLISFLISVLIFGTVVGGCALLLPEYAFYLITFVFFVFIFLSFFIRMETVYFEADRLDREDEIRSYREL